MAITFFRTYGGNIDVDLSFSKFVIRDSWYEGLVQKKLLSTSEKTIIWESKV